MIKKLLFISIIISFSLCKNKIGFISNVEGHVEILTDQKQKTVLNAVPGRYVYEGDVIRSYKESFCTIIFTDQTAFFTIGSYSEAHLYNEDLGLKKVKLSYGNLYVENKSKLTPLLIFTRSSQIEAVSSTVFVETNIEGDDSIYSINAPVDLYNKSSNLSINIPAKEKAKSYKDGIIELSNTEDDFLPKNITATITKTPLDLKTPPKEIEPMRGDLIPAYNTERNLDIYTPLKKSPFSLSVNGGLSSINDNAYLVLSLNASYKKKRGGIDLILDYYLKTEDSPEINSWDSSDKLLSKIKKISYRNKTNSLNVIAGNINNVSFGHGVLVRNFSNQHNYPFINRFGAFLEYNNRDFISSKLFISDLESLSSNAAILGLHNSLFISKYVPLKMGIGFVTDMNQFYDAEGYSLDSRQFNALEFDFTYDLYTKKGYDINLISEIAATLFPDRHYYKRYDSDELGSGLKNKSGTWGSAIGVEGAYSDFVNFKGLFHYNDPLFQVSFFNNTYELERFRRIEKLDAYSDGIQQIENMFVDYEVDSENGVFVPKDLYGSYLQNELVYSSIGFSLDASYNYYNKILGYVYFSTFFEVGSPNETNSFSSINLNIEIMDKVIRDISSLRFYLSRNYSDKLFDFISDYNENTIIGLSLDTKIKKNIIFNFSFNRVSYDYDLDFDTDKSDNISIGFRYNFI